MAEAIGVAEAAQEEKEEGEEEAEGEKEAGSSPIITLFHSVCVRVDVCTHMYV